MTTGLEIGAAVFGLIAGAVEITHKAIEIYNAVEDKSGIPKSLKKVSEKLPSVEGLLRDAKAQWMDKQFEENEQTMQDFEHCKNLCQELHDLLLSIYPKADLGKGGRFLRGTKTVFSSKAKTAEGLMKEIRECLALLTSRLIISNAAALKIMIKDPPKGEGYTQHRCALVSNDNEHHGSVSRILQSWTSRSDQTSSLVPSSKTPRPLL